MFQLAYGRKFAVLVLSLALLPPWSAQALFFDRPLGELTEWFTLLFGDVGCSWDPSGSCRAPGTDQLDVGCSMDPSGTCHDTGAAEPALPDASREVGCSADPNGGGCHG